MHGTATIYGLKRGDRFEYVGVTRNPKNRKAAHRCGKRQELRGCLFVVLREVPLENGFRVESQIIRAFKRRGECPFNVYTDGKAGGPGWRRRTPGFIAAVLAEAERGITNIEIAGILKASPGLIGLVLREAGFKYPNRRRSKG